MACWVLNVAAISGFSPPPKSGPYRAISHRRVRPAVLAMRSVQALVRALPVYAADALITVDGDLDEIDRPALRSAVMELLEYRATLDATTPAKEGGDGE